MTGRTRRNTSTSTTVRSAGELLLMMPRASRSGKLVRPSRRQVLRGMAKALLPLPRIELFGWLHRML